MKKLTFEIRSPAHQQNAIHAVQQILPDPTKPIVVTIQERNRSLDQNRKLWACLGDVSRQVEWHGRWLDAESWKCVFTGHYRTTAAAPQLRFDERNIHKQCVVCNQHKSGNLVPYRVELISRIGQEAVDEIESNHNRHRWTVEECRAIKAEYQQKLKDLRNSRSEAA